MKAANPFPGLRPFRPEESALFFGRDEQIGEALDRLLERRLLAVVGVSGCGKSSLVQAGMLPALEMGLAGDPAQRWRIATMRPGDGPLRELRRCLAFGEDALAERSYGLLEAAETHLAEGEKLLLLVDQFEEIFPFRDRKLKEGAASEADLFVSYLLRAAQAPAERVYVLLTMRSDYLGECAKFHGLPEALNDGQYLVPRMTRQQLQEAIEGPLQAADVKMQPALLQELLNQCDEEPDNLPLLQHLLWRLFEEWPGEGLITREMAAAVGGLGGALDQDASRVFASLDSSQQAVAEVVFRRITESRRQADREEEDRPVRRPQTVASLALLAGVSESALRAVVTAFEERGLLVVRSTDAGDKVDLPHECLCLRWEMLRRWVDVEAQDAKTLRFLEESVGKSHLTGSALDEARAWLKAGRLSGTWCLRYLPAGRVTAVADWVRESGRIVDDAAERERALRDAELKREAEKRRTALRTAMVLGLVALGFAGLGWWAWRQKSVADQQRAAAAWSAARALAGQRAADEQKDRAESAEKTAEANLLKSKVSQQQAEAAAARATASERVARTQSTASLARQLAFASDIAASENTRAGMKAVLLATASLRQSPTPDGEWALNRHLEKLPKSRHAVAVPGRISISKLSKDGRWAAIGSDIGIQVVEIATGKTAWRSDGFVSALAFRPDGNAILSNQAGDFGPGAVPLVETQTGKLISTFEHAEVVRVRALAFDESGGRVATGDSGGSLRLFEVKGAGAQKPKCVIDNLGPIIAVSFAARSVLVGISNREPGTEDVVAVDAATCSVRTRLKTHGYVSGLAVSPNGERVAITSSSGLRVVEIATGHQIWSRNELGSRHGAVAFDPEGHRILMGGDSNAKVLDAATGSPLSQVSHPDSLVSVAWAPDGRGFLTSCEDGSVRMIEVPESTAFSLPGDESSRVSTTPGGEMIAVGTRKQLWLFHGATTKREVWQKATSEDISAVALSPNGKWLAAGTGDRVVRVWASLSGDPVGQVSFGYGRDLAISADGRRVAVSDLGGRVAVSDLASGKTLREVEGHNPALSSDGKFVALSLSTGFTLVDVDSGKELWRLDRKGYGASTYVFSPDSRWFALSVQASGQEETHIVLADAGRTVWSAPFSADLLSFSTDSRWIASGRTRQSVSVMDVATGREAHRVAISHRPASARFSPDSRWLILGQEEITARNPMSPYDDRRRTIYTSRHPLEAEDLIRDACGKVTRNLTLAEWRQYVGREIPYARSCDNLPYPPDYKP